MKYPMQSRRPRILQRAALLAMLLTPLLASAAPPAPSKCKLVAVAQIPIDMRNTSPAISAAIDGHPARMLIDTGSFISLIFRGAAAEFGLHVVEGAGKQLLAVGGVENAGLVTVRDFNIAGFVVHNLILTAAGHGKMSSDYAGILGEDFLSHWDLEFDPTAAVLRLITPQNCSGDQVVYWAPQYSMVSLVPNWWHFLEADVQLNGNNDVLAMFDTGAGYTVVTTEVAKRPGLHPITESAAGTGHGVAAAAVAFDTAVFPSITIGQETIQNPKLQVADLFRNDREVMTGSMIASAPEGEPEMLIGVDFFRAHHVYVARGQKKMYFTYVGGPVFRDPSRPPAPASAPTRNPATAGAPTAPPAQAPSPPAPPPGNTSNPAAAK